MNTPFGRALLPLFALNASYTNLNQGSYGAPPHAVLDAGSAIRARVEANPDRFFRMDLFSLLPPVIARLARMVGASPEDVVLIDNASHGVNAVLRSLHIPIGKKILTLNVAYCMVKNTVKYLSNEWHAQSLEVSVQLPEMGDDEIVAAVEQALVANTGGVHVASFSHIVSLPSVILPVERLVALCHKHGVLVLIDGAHALGQIPLALDALDADFYVANGHKWLNTAKGSALLWARRNVQRLIEPTTISWEGQGASHFQAAFSYEGTADYSAVLSMGAALDFRQRLGGEDAVMHYMHSLAVQGGELAAAAWGTSLLFADHSRFGAMVDVRLPAHNASIDWTDELLNGLAGGRSTYVPIYGDGHGGEIARISCAVYNDLDDIRFFATTVKRIIAKHAVK
eukprot:CAMPEP_0183360190 /NCGR_PEP_ID=MMETSP0164_2-20130417/54549_1 /TAXON_ID=221442 /ORGANISM="Coccolithus pelagicus ssp braarudi, Strain PLY182g" /LENGTH=396 /DNA_ID=CAMNT_0025534491 /DNA_START=12 /DNA_END=1202 /DNA_ORIENTATION=+